jgi:two-component sensor histidine kinase/Flp pilus assembly protein TadD
MKRLLTNMVVISWLMAASGWVNTATAQSKVDSILNLSANGIDTTTVNRLNVMAVELFYRDLNGSRQLAERALEIASQVRFRRGEAEALKSLGAAMMRQGQFAQALKSCREAEIIFVSLNDKPGIANVLNTIGMVYNQQGQYPPALENFNKALKIRQELNQQELVPPLIENIGIVHFRQGDYSLALNYFNECFLAFKSQGNEASASKILVNLGATYNKLNQPLKALEAHRQSLEYFKKTDNLVGTGIAYNNIGSVYFMLKDYRRAVTNYEQSLGVKRQVKDQRGISVSLANLAEAYIALNQMDHAKESIDQSLKIAEDIGAKEQIKVAYDLLSRIYERTRDYERALNYERKMSSAKDSIFSADKTEQISRMRAIYETEQAERDARLTRLQAELEIGKKDFQRNIFIVATASLMLVAMLIYYLYQQKQKSNHLLSEKNIVIEQALLERETLLREIHHRVKNNLQIISSLLSLQSKSLQDADAQGAIRESRNRVKSMSLIHEQLYQEDAISGVEMEGYIRHLVESLISSYGLESERITRVVKADKILLDVDSAIPLGLILNELISNSLKYAFPGSQTGNLVISLLERDTELFLVVQDDGVGINSGKKNESSFGLTMVNSLMRKLKAEMSITSEGGTRVEIRVRDFKKISFT